MSVTAAEFRRVTMLAEMSEVTLATMGPSASRQQLSSDQIIALEGSAEPPVGFILSGCVRLFRNNSEGREQTLIRLCPGMAFYLPPAFDDDHRAHASTQAVGETEVFVIPQPEFRRITQECPDIAIAVLRELSHLTRHIVSLTCDLGLLSVRGRLARFLLDHVKNPQAPPTRWTHEAIASNIGTVREVVSRTLRGFVRDGLIRLDRHMIEVLDQEALEAQAKC